MEDTSEKTIYDLGLHEGIYFKNYQIYIMRVPGGWIYYYRKSLVQPLEDGVFIPFNDEFHDKNANVDVIT